MAADSNLFCRVFLDHPGPSEEIERFVSGLMGAKPFKGELEAAGMEIVVDHGDNHPPLEERDYSQWINWKYSLEICASDPGASNTDFAAKLRPLLEKLHEAGVKAVPACDFEELLMPWNLVNAEDQ